MRTRDPDELTDREREVLELLRRDFTNEQIAQRLGISLDGAKYHVSQILSKLGVATREEAAATPVAEAFEPRRRWWAAWPLLARIAGAATVAAAATGLVVLAWGVFRTLDPGSIQVTGEIGTYQDRNGFNSFVEKLAQAVEERDVGFFVENRHNTESLIRVIEPDSVGSLTADYADFLDHYLTAMAEDETDRFGGESTRLYAYSVIKPDRGGGTAEGMVETVNAIVTSRAPGPPGDIPPAGRTILIVDASFDGERWGITRLTIGGGDWDPEMLLTFLEAPTSAGGAVFDFWKRWK